MHWENDMQKVDSRKKYGYPNVELISFEGSPDYIKFDDSRNDEWHIYQFGYMKEYLHRLIKGWSVADFFPKVDVSRIALYSHTVFAEEVAADLRRKSNDNIYVSDKNEKAWSNRTLDIEILPFDNLLQKYMDGKIEKIIICSFFYENEIMDDLLKAGFKLNDIVTLATILLN